MSIVAAVAHLSYCFSSCSTAHGTVSSDVFPLRMGRPNLGLIHCTCFLGFITRFHNPNDISIGSAVFAQLSSPSVAKHVGACHSPTKLPLPMGYQYSVLRSSAWFVRCTRLVDSASQTASQSVQPFLGNRFTKGSSYAIGPFVCNVVGLLWPNGSMDQDETWHGGRLRPHCVRWEPSSPNFRPMYCGQTTGWIKMPLGTQVGLGPGHIVLYGDPAPSPPPPPKKRHSSPQFSAHVCCAQSAGWINMPLGMEVDLGPGDTALGLYGDQLPQ